MNYEADKASEKPIARGVRAGLADTITQSDDTGATTTAETPAAGLVAALKSVRYSQGVPEDRFEGGSVERIAAAYEARDRADRARLEAHIAEMGQHLDTAMDEAGRLHSDRNRMEDRALKAEKELAALRAGIKSLVDDLRYHRLTQWGDVDDRLTSLLSTTPIGAQQQQPGGDDGDPTAEAERAGEEGS